MIEILGLLLIAYILIAMEAIVPGGILGILGIAGLFFATYFAYLEYGGWFAPSLTFLMGGLGALITIFVEFKWLAKSPLGKRLFLKDTVAGTSNKEVAKLEVVGEKAITLTDLHPEGRILVNEIEYDAVSESGLLPKGSDVLVIAIENFRLRVRED